ncbi:hypothetical protein CR513_37847, partial [Mucuna pruriens]
MIAFFNVCYIDIWDVLENRRYIPTNKNELEIPISSWNTIRKQALRPSKDLKKFSMKELLGTFKVYEIELNKDEENDLLKKENESLKEEKAKDLSKEIIDLRQNLSKFVNGYENLKKILKNKRRPYDKTIRKRH